MLSATNHKLQNRRLEIEDERSYLAEMFLVSALCFLLTSILLWAGVVGPALPTPPCQVGFDDAGGRNE